MLVRATALYLLALSGARCAIDTLCQGTPGKAAGEANLGELARRRLGEDRFGYRREFLRLTGVAQALAK